jgi:hypothetical protein
MAVMVATTPLTSVAFSRRTLLAASAAGLGALLVGCTSNDGKAPVTAQQADQLAGQVSAQQALVDAFAAAAAADPALGTAVADLTTQVKQQLDRLKAAAPGPSSSASPSAPAVPAGQDPRAWLGSQVTATADSHAKACVDQTGARAALLGSIAAGLRGMAGQLA